MLHHVVTHPANNTIQHLHSSILTGYILGKKVLACIPHKLCAPGSHHFVKAFKGFSIIADTGNYWRVPSWGGCNLGVFAQRVYLGKALPKSGFAVISISQLADSGHQAPVARLILRQAAFALAAWCLLSSLPCN